MGLTEEGRLHQAQVARARCFVALLIEEAQRQGCLQEVSLYRDHFVLWAVLSSPLLASYVEVGIISLQDLFCWVDEVLREAARNGTITE